MRVAFGFKAHSGWAALVAVGSAGGRFEIVDRCRMELVEESQVAWAKQPYHAAEELEPRQARTMVARGIRAARRNAVLGMRAALRRAEEAGHTVAACAVLMGEPMPEWSLDQILAVHFRMHQAEGGLFRDVLARAVTGCGARLVAVPEKRLHEAAARALKTPAAAWQASIAALGKAVGPPWGKDQKDAVLAAMIALGAQKRGRTR